MKKDYEETIAKGRIYNYEKPWFNRALNWMRRMPARQRILDIGCGNSELEERIRDLFGYAVVCIDIAQSNVRRAIEKGFDAYQIDLDQSPLPFKDGELDTVISLEVIEHIFDTDHVLSEAYRVLCSDGYFIVSTPNIASWPYRIYALKGNIPYKEGHHVRFFNPRRLKLYLFLNGFDIVETDHIWYDISQRSPAKWLIRQGLKYAVQLSRGGKLRNAYETLYAQGLVYLCRKNIEAPPVGVSEHCWAGHRSKPEEYKLLARKRTEEAFSTGLIREDTRWKILSYLT